MKTFLIVSALVISAAAFAGPTKTISCAVMSGNKVDIAKATKSHSYADYKGNRYFFCCGGCPAEFKANPAKYAKTAPHIKTPTPAPKAK
jgi:YHS domain-containing protein